MKAEIARTIDLSHTAPLLPSPMVSRPHLVQTVTQIFNSSTDLVCVEGASGYGKTVLLREFANLIDEPCFSVFLTAYSRISYDPVLARVDFANQVNWFLTNKRLADDLEPTDGYLRTLWMKCAQRLLRTRNAGYIIVDGIHHVPPEEEPIKRAIMSLLPFGVKPFRFLFSGDIDKDVNPYCLQLRKKSFQISTFGAHETDEFLKDLVDEKKLRNEYHTAHGGVPSFLASIRRQVDAAPDTGIEHSPTFSTDIEALFDAEWTLRGEISDTAKKALAVMLSYGYTVDTQTLSTHCSADEVVIEAELRRLPFVAYSEKAGGWTFASETYRSFAEKKLAKLVEKTTEAIVARLLDDPDADKSLIHLPGYLEKIGKAEKLLDWFNEDRLATILRKERTAARIEPTLNKAIAISHESKNDLVLTIYALLRSTIRQVSNTTGIDYEIRARAALGDYDGALAVANDVPLLTQRLRLLAVMAHTLSKTPGYPVRRLVDEITDLAKQIDLKQLPNDEAIDIAIDLYPVEPQLASRVLKEVLQGNIEDASFELTVARISLAAIFSKPINTQAEANESGHPIPTDLMVNKKLQQFLSVSRAFFHTKSVQDLLDSTISIDDPSERLFVLRKWISQHPFKKDALDVVESAIDDAIRMSEFAPNATFYREIATPLPFAKDTERRRRLVAVIDGQKAVIKAKGPIVDYVRLELQLAHCNFIEANFNRAASRLEELYFDHLEPIRELETRITCLAWFVSELEHFDPAQDLNSHSPIREVVDDDLETTLKLIIESGADHFTILSSALGALALYLPEAAVAIAGRLNTIDRRNQAFFHVAVSMCRADTIVPSALVLLPLLDEMQLSEERDSAIKEITHRFADDLVANKRSMEDLQSLLEKAIHLCTSPGVRAECLGIMASAIARSSKDTPLYETISQQLLIEFDSIGTPGNKCRIACQLIAELTSSSPELAKKLFEYLADPNRGVPMSENVEHGLFLILDLLTKATFALAQSKLLREEDVHRVSDLIANARDPLMKITLFAMLAFFLRKTGDNNLFSIVLNQRLWPTLSKLEVRDQALQYRAWTVAYPVVWLEDRDRARSAVASFSANVRNDCTSALINSILRGQPQGEPFDDDSPNIGNMGNRLTYLDIRNLLRLCEETDDDTLIFKVFEWIADVVETELTETQLTKDQKAEISRFMIELADKKLPIAQRIQHSGYQILCKSQALRVFGSSTENWSSLIASGEKLKNEADRLFVLACIASSLPNKNKKKRDQLFTQIETEIGELRIQEDQFNRYCVLSSLVSKKDKPTASRIVEKAFAMLLGDFNHRTAIKENRLVDLAYKVDPELPMKLAVIYDDDPARDKYKERAQKQMAAHQLRKDLGDHRSQVELNNMRDDAQLANAAWQALAALNSGRMVATNMARLRDMLMCASNYPLKTSYPMYSWVLTNAMIKYANTNEASKYVRDMFEGVLRGAKFFFNLADPESQVTINPIWQNLGDTQAQTIVQCGERDKALQFLQQWIEKNGEEYITIIDPYFGVSDLHLLLQIVQLDPTLKVHVITGKAKQRNVKGNLSSAYSEAWRQLCDHSPPETEVLVVGSVQNGTAPFHDRWILTRSAGIQLGTSINSLGNRDSVITILGGEEVTKISNMIEKYQSRQMREKNGDRLSYEFFELVV